MISCTRPVDKKVTAKRSKSAFRDASFRNLFKALGLFDQAVVQNETSVIYTYTTITPTPANTNTPINTLTQQPAHITAIKNLKRTQLKKSQRPQCQTRTFKLTTANTPARLNTSPAPEALTEDEQVASDRFWKSYEKPSLKTYTAPAPWRDLSDQARLEWFHTAARTIDQTHAFTLNLDPAIEAKAKAAPSAVKFLATRISKHLKAELTQAPAFWFTLELTDGGRLHLHGEIVTDTSTITQARKSLRLAGGEWEQNARQFQAETKPNPTIGWVNYSTKAAWRIRETKRQSSPINGDWYFATNEIRSTASRIYTGERARVIELMENLSKPAAVDDALLDHLLGGLDLEGLDRTPMITAEDLDQYIEKQAPAQVQAPSDLDLALADLDLDFSSVEPQPLIEDVAPVQVQAESQSPIDQPIHHFLSDLISEKTDQSHTDYIDQLLSELDEPAPATKPAHRLTSDLRTYFAPRHAKSHRTAPVAFYGTFPAPPLHKPRSRPEQAMPP